MKEAYGTEVLEGVVLQRLDERWQPIAGTEGDLPCDVLCLAVGLTPLTELLFQAGCEMRYVPELGGHVAVRDEDLMTTVPGLYVAGDVSGDRRGLRRHGGGQPGRRWLPPSALGHGGAEAERRRAAYLEELRELRCGPMGQKIRDGICRLAG